MQESPIITYVETRSFGHYPVWVRAVVQAFCRLRPAARLHVWVSRDFRSAHREWAEQYFGSLESAAVHFACYETLFASPTGYAPVARLPEEIEIIHNCVRVDKSCVCYIAYLDGQLRNIALGRFNRLRSKLVGVLDQPYLHYREFENPALPSGFTWATLVKARVVHFAAAHRRVIGRILMGDPMAPAYHRRALGSEKFQFLPEPFSAIPPSIYPRRSLSLPEDRILLLFIGSTEKRKGICQLLSALEVVLSENAGFERQISLVLAGRVIDETRVTVEKQIARLRRNFPGFTIAEHNRFLTEQEFADFLTASDVVCMPYITMVGTSGVLTHAVHAARIVLASNFGITGELVRRYKLGVVCNSTEGSSLRRGLIEAIEMAKSKGATDRVDRDGFLGYCTASFEEVGEAIVNHLMEIGGINR